MRRRRTVDVYGAVKELQEGGGHVRVVAGWDFPDKTVFDFELPSAPGAVAWEPLMWRTLRDVVYRRFLDQAISMHADRDRPRVVSIRIEFTPSRRSEL